MPRLRVNRQPVQDVTKHEGGFRHILLGALVANDPSKAAVELRNALKANKGNKVHTARSLDIARKTLCRWIEKLRTQGLDVEASTTAT